MYTEDEAKNKWCPMSRSHILPHDISGNRKSEECNIEVNNKCIASDCMMWVEVDVLYSNIKKGFCGISNKYQ